MSTASPPVTALNRRMAEQSAPPAGRSAWGVFARRHFSPFKVVYRPEAPVAVMLNPKVGTTTFRAVLVEALQAAGAAPQLGWFWPVTQSRRYLTSSPARLCWLLSAPSRASFWCFVRNPYARLLSAWRDKLAFRHEDGGFPRSTQKWVPVIRRFACSRNLPGQGEHEPIPFATFVAWIESQPEGARDQHWDTQRSVLFCDLIRYSRVYGMETEFATGVCDFFTRLGLSTEGLAAKLKKPSNASRRLEAPAYTPELAEQVYRIYQGDFREFGYDPNSWQGM